LSADPIELLHPDLRQWIWNQKWRALRPIQRDAIPVVLTRTQDVLVTAPTAGGKTEAAYIPILSDLATHEARNQLGVLCISPLRALINDQTRRLQSMTEAANLRVQAWHGDISAGRSAFWKRPTEVMITTPESLEAMLMRRAKDFGPLTKTLRYIVIDELHSFLAGERGAQLQSLLRRVEALAGIEIPRVALSATLADTSFAAEFLRPTKTRPVTIVRPDTSAGSDLRVVVKAVIEPDSDKIDPAVRARLQDLDTIGELPAPPASPSAEAPAGGETQDPLMTGGIASIAEHLFSRLRGDTHLVFANARARVEVLTSLLVGCSEAIGVPNEFFAHHGSLSREQRIEVEERLRDGVLPTTAIATSTLEMGIDLGDVASVAQIGPAPSVSALKQRVGRSGRRAGAFQTLRQYIQLRPLTDRSHPVDHLRLPLVLAIAHLELMAEGTYEPPLRGDLHLSTLVQQILSIIYQSGRGTTAADLWSALGGPGPFGAIERATFVSVLRALGAAGVLEQSDDGTLLPGEIGEKIAENYRFYASFATPEEFTLLVSGRAIGRLPVDSLVANGQCMLFAGRRWRVIEVRPADKVILLEPARGGQPPDFGGGAPQGHRIVHERMRLVLEDTTSHDYLDDVAAGALAFARSAYRAYGLDQHRIVDAGPEFYLLHWAGSRIGRTLALLLQRDGFTVEDDGPVLFVSGGTRVQLDQTLEAIAKEGSNIDPASITALVPALVEEKFETCLQSDRSLLERGWSARWLDLVGAASTAQQLVGARLQ
jgi:ATP-dependent Lhr-like helicase